MRNMKQFIAQSADMQKLYRGGEPKRPEEEEIGTVKQSTQVNMSFESATDFVNKPLKFFDSSPLEALRVVKLGNLTKLTLIY